MTFGIGLGSQTGPGNRPTKCDTMERPQNFELAVYLAEKHREKMTNDDAFKKIAGVYNMKWRVLKRNFEYVCWVNDSIKELAIKTNNN